ncbi:MAG: hypothetical protein ACE5FF_14545 [Saprospiraceae bacterium]
MNRWGQSLKKIVEKAAELTQIKKSTLCYGDVVQIFTHNSVYTVFVLEGGLYLVSGGWFDRKDLSPIKTTITGCTWGGSIIKLDVLAACGLCIEFGNRVVTTPVRKVCLIPNGGIN